MTVGKGYKSFCEYIENKSISLIGLGISNLPLIPFFLQSGAKCVTVRDLKKGQDDKNILEAKSNGATVFLGDGYLDDLKEDIVLRSPGIRPDIPSFLKAKEEGSVITCETELFLRFAPCKRIAVTGSDGKTTTTTLIAKILEKAGYRVHLGGNIGKAMLPQLFDIKSEKSVAVMELSSFQLMHCKYSPDVAIITNLAENHLDWHRDMEEYLDAKKNILRYQSQINRAVLNFDNDHTRACEPVGKRCFFTYSKDNLNKIPSTDDVIFYDDSRIYARIGGSTKPVLDTGDILLPGKHNIENYMAAIGATAGLAANSDVKEIATTFGGVEHRIELVRVLNGVSYYNSSIDSSPSRSTAALRAFKEKVIMIAGGYDKNLDYTGLGNEICKHVKTLILCGMTSEKIRKATLSSPLYQEDSPKIIFCEKFDDTVKIARESAEDSDKVILSPASASFDLFKNFDERGKYFKKLIMELK